MVRTADRYSKTFGGGKGGKKTGGGSSVKGSSVSRANRAGTSGTSNSGGGNRVCPRETPDWQLPITRFLGKDENGHSSNEDEPVPSTSQANHEDDDLEDGQEDFEPPIEEETSSNPSSDSEKLQIDSRPPTPSNEKISSNEKEVSPKSTSPCKTPSAETKRRSNHINILTPKRIKTQA